MGYNFIGTPHLKGAGYFHNDNRASGGVLEESDVRTCPHCQAIIQMQVWKKVENGKMSGGFCTKCSAPICGTCNKRMQTEGCVPFIKRIDDYLSASMRYQQFSKLAGLEPPEPPRALILPANVER